MKATSAAVLPTIRFIATATAILLGLNVVEVAIFVTLIMPVVMEVAVTLKRYVVTEIGVQLVGIHVGMAVVAVLLGEHAAMEVAVTLKRYVVTEIGVQLVGIHVGMAVVAVLLGEHAAMEVAVTLERYAVTEIGVQLVGIHMGMAVVAVLPGIPIVGQGMVVPHQTVSVVAAVIVLLVLDVAMGLLAVIPIILSVAAMDATGININFRGNSL